MQLSQLRGSTGQGSCPSWHLSRFTEPSSAGLFLHSFFHHPTSLQLRPGPTMRLKFAVRLQQRRKRKHTRCCPDASQVEGRVSRALGVRSDVCV